MKHTFTSVLLIALIWTRVEAQDWKVVQFPLTESITGITFVHPDTGHAVTEGGKHARTFDGGRTWSITKVTLNISLEDVNFVDGMTGLVCGRRGSIYRTSDGGRIWQNVSWPDTAVTLISIRMFDDQIGLATGLKKTAETIPPGIALRTTDAGRTWKKVDLPCYAIGDICYSPDGVVYCMSIGQMNISEDKGKTWKSSKIGSGKPARAVVISGNNGIAFGNGGMCAFTQDKGKTWHHVSMIDDQRNFICAVMQNDTVGYVGGTKSSLLRTTDGGQTWQRELMARSFDIFCLYLIGSQLWAVGTDGGMIRKKVY